MHDIKVKLTTQDHEYFVFKVLVSGGSGAPTEHKVKVSRRYHDQLTHSKITPEALVQKSFIFLLERESKESILAEFKLSDIQKYFSDYEMMMGR